MRGLGARGSVRLGRAGMGCKERCRGPVQGPVFGEVRGLGDALLCQGRGEAVAWWRLELASRKH